MPMLAIVFSKVPTPGNSKSRLTGAFSPIERAMIHKACLADAVKACVDEGFETEIHYVGGRAEDFFLDLGGDSELRRAIGSAARFVPQPDGDLGARMSFAFDRALLGRNSADAAILMGSDVPSIDSEVLRQAVDAIALGGVALGPALDGGYYLIGMKRPHSSLFKGIEYSRSDVASRTIEAAKAAGLDLRVIEARRDLDTPEDVAAFIADAEGDERLRRGYAWRYLSKITQRMHS
jgi:uncharacterized protein